MWRCQKESTNTLLQHQVKKQSRKPNCNTWTYEENHQLLKAYFQVNPKIRGYRQRLFREWKKTGLHLNVNEQNLCDKARYLLKCNYFSELELETLKKQEQVLPSAQESYSEETIQDTDENTISTLTEHAVISGDETSTSGSFYYDTHLCITYPTPINFCLHLILEIMKDNTKQGCLINLKRFRKNPSLFYHLALIDQSLSNVSINDTTQLINLYQSCKIYLLEHIRDKNTSSKSKQNTKNSKIRLKNQLDTIRQKIGRLTMFSKGKIRKFSIIHRIQNEYPNKTEVNKECENLKQKAAVLAQKIRNIDRLTLSKQHNRDFENNPTRFLEFLNKHSGTKATPENFDKARCLEFWKNIWEKQIEPINSKKSMFLKINKFYSNTKQEADYTISIEELHLVLRKASNFKAAGPDGIQNILLKRLKNLHHSIIMCFNKLLVRSTIPKELVAGRTILLQKSDTDRFDVTNYRPITCLSNVWKIFSACLSNQIYNHLQRNKILPNEQKGCIKRSMGTVEQLLIDKAVTNYAKKKKISQYVAWIDFRKAYDSLSHEWIFKCLKMFGISDNIQKLLLNAFSLFETELNYDNIPIGQVKIQRGIYQGDSLSPLLFIMALAPLSMLLNSDNMGFKIPISDKIRSLSHLLFVDDIKIYASSNKNLKNLLHITENFGKAVGLEFGFNKCSVATSKRGNKAVEQPVCLKSGTINPLESFYKYLGIWQDSEPNLEKTKESLKANYLTKVDLICNSHLNGKNTTNAINTLAVPVITYAAAVLQWSQSELQCLDRETRKLLIKHGVFHRNSCTKRLYVKRTEGGRGFLNIENQVQKQVTKTWMNIRKRSACETLLHVVTTYLNTSNPIINEKTFTEMHKEKPLHGQFMRDQKHIPHSFLWLNSSVFKQTESLIFAAHEQCVPTRYYCSKILKENICGKCRLCEEKPESIEHVLSNCSVLAKTNYIERHNIVGRKIYLAHLKKDGVTITEELTKAKIYENQRIKIVWDWPIQTSKHIQANRPDMIIIDKHQNTCTLFDFSFPWDSRVGDKYAEKVSKYIPLANEVKMIWNLSSVKVQPIIIGALGTINSKMVKELRALNIGLSTRELQTIVIEESAKILRQVLNIK